MKEIYIARHGQTIENIEETIQGQIDGKLSDTGIGQARQLGEKLKEIKFNIIYSSDLGRAKETLELILENITCENIESVQELRERNFGNIQGKNMREVGLTEYPASEVYAWNKEKIFNDAETLESIKIRAETMINKIKNTPYQRILLVGHEWFNSYLINVFLNESWRLHTQDNARFHYLALGDDGKVLACKFNVNSL